MLFDKILKACNRRFLENRHCKDCDNCTYDGHCPNAINECEKCLEWIHYPDRVPTESPPRRYDCHNMADFYVCKYASKYVSELIYAFENLTDIKDRKHLKVLSFGCGPCTDLLALDYLQKRKIYKYETLEFRGVDYEEDVWGRIHGDLKRKVGEWINIRYFYEDACEIIEKIANGKWVPDLVTFQYLFSDLRKNSEAEKIASFISTFAEYANEKMKPGSYIILNDINLSIRWEGGREYFDRLLRKLDKDFVYRTGHFLNSNPNKGTFIYGEQYDSNSLRVDASVYDIPEFYQPFESCSSAQMLIKREESE